MCAVCVRAREREREVVTAFLSPPRAAAKQNVLWRCCSLRLSHPFTHSCSLGSLPLSLTRHTSPSPSLSSPSYITGYVCVSCCSVKALRAVCNHWKGVSCKHAWGGVHRWQHHPPCSARAPSPCPSIIHFYSSLPSFILYIHPGRREHHHQKFPFREERMALTGKLHQCAQKHARWGECRARRRRVSALIASIHFNMAKWFSPHCSHYPEKTTHEGIDGAGQREPHLHN